MPPSEESILSNFLLTPSLLPTIISLEKFTELFPAKLRSHPQVKTLYRELQQLRAQDVDLVRENIDRELGRGERQKQELKNAQKSPGVSGMDHQDLLEADMDVHLFGQPSKTAPEHLHSLQSLLPEMQHACSSLEKETETTELETTRILGELNDVVSELSDLRYGKFNKPTGASNSAVEEAIGGLKRLEDAAKRVSASGRQE